jgi:hypothetical protein
MIRQTSKSNVLLVQGLWPVACLKVIITIWLATPPPSFRRRLYRIDFTCCWDYIRKQCMHSGRRETNKILSSVHILYWRFTSSIFRFLNKLLSQLNFDLCFFESPSTLANAESLSRRSLQVYELVSSKIGWNVITSINLAAEWPARLRDPFCV